MLHYRAHDHRRALWDSLPLGEFLRIDSLKSLELPNTTVILKIRSAVPTLNLSEQSLCTLPFGTFSVVMCAGLLMAYQFVMPSCRDVLVGYNFVSFKRKQHISDDAPVIFTDKLMAVMGNDDALLALKSSQQWTARQPLDTDGD